MQISDKNREARGIALTALICAVLQLAIAPNVGLGNGRANLALVFAATVALTTGGGRAELCGFFAGLFYDLSSTGPLGLMALSSACAALPSAVRAETALSGEFASGILLFVAADLAVNLGYGLGLMLAGQGGGFVDAVFLRALPGGAAVPRLLPALRLLRVPHQDEWPQPRRRPLQEGTLGRRAWTSRFSS